jgi:uncharacterized membrane protein YfcA
MSWGAAVVLAAGGVVAGALGTAGGITSLVSYPALLAVGVPALQADVANLVAVVACWPGSLLASRRELVGTGTVLGRGAPTAAAGAAVGAGLLLVTPSGVFAGIVPFLVAGGSLALLAQPVLTDRMRARPEPGTVGLPALLLIGLLSVYGGYFGAGSGVLLLVAALVLLEPSLTRANAVKNMLVGAGAVASAVVLVASGPVDWAAVGPLALGLFTGSLLGPALTRSLPARVVRIGVVLMGFVLAVELWLHPA